jgi:glycosyltransferase involved in cell wall biosynthesis
MRLLLITNVFPTPLLATKGPFNLELVRALSREHEVRVICPIAWTDELQAKRLGRPMPAQRHLSVEGAVGVEAYYPRYYFPPKVLRRAYGWFMWHSVRATVRKELSCFRPDAVVGYWAHPDGEVAVRAATLAGVPSAVMVGGSDVLLLTHETGRRAGILRVLDAANTVVAVSEDLREKLVALGVGADKIHVVPRGVDTTRFRPGDRAEARRRLGIAPGAPMLLWVGRIHRVKGLDVLIDACARLRSGNVPFHVYLVGEGPEREALRAQAAAAGLGDAVSFVGPVAHADLPDWYRAADVTVLPSRSEGVPNVLRESLACGTPFVASRVGGVSELADPSSALVPPEDAGALSVALAAAIQRATAPDAGSRARDAERPASGSWADSAEALVRVLRPLTSANAKRQVTGEPAPVAVES